MNVEYLGCVPQRIIYEQSDGKRIVSIIKKGSIIDLSQKSYKELSYLEFKIITDTGIKRRNK